MCEPNRPLHAILREVNRHLGQRDVHRRKDDTQTFGVEQHGDLWTAREVRQEVGVARHGSRLAPTPPLLMGAVAMASSRPARASVVAVRMASKAARAPSAVATPGRNAVWPAPRCGP